MRRAPTSCCSMSEVHLSGQLVCKTEDEARVVSAHLPEHIQCTRAEPGCVSFTVTITEVPLIWEVEERFEDQPAFEFHQKRVASSDWGKATADVERHYSIEGLSRSRTVTEDVDFRRVSSAWARDALGFSGPHERGRQQRDGTERHAAGRGPDSRCLVVGYQ